MRLDTFLSRFGGISRRQSRKLIKTGRVEVNGAKIRNPEFKIPENSSVFLDGNRIVPYGKLYIAMNKPVGYVCSKSRTEGLSVYDLINEVFSSKLSIAGRLDKNSRGLLLLSNDGNFVHEIISPRKKIEKEYIVKVEEKILPEQLQILLQHVDIGKGEYAKAESVQFIDIVTFSIVLTEGKYHEIRRMVKSALKNNVVDLKRIRIGGYHLPGDLHEGEWRILTEEEIKAAIGKILR